MARKDEDRPSSREYVALKAAREMASKSTRATIQRVTRVLRSERRKDETHDSSSTAAASAGQ
jgi:hypothetical protein